jgi:hypothetical protein
MDSYTKIDVVLDLHGDEISRFNYIYFRNRSTDKLQDEFLSTLDQSLPAVLALPKQTFLKRFLKHLIRRRRILTETGMTLSEFAEKKYAADAYTLEVSAHATSEHDCRLIGQHLVNALLRSYNI